MQNTEQHIHEVEVSLDAAKKVVAFGDAIDRLFRNPDFQTVIDDGYFTQEARRLAFLTADKNVSETVREFTHHSVRSIGELQMFFQLKRNEAELARNAIAQYEEELDRARHGEFDAEVTE